MTVIRDMQLQLLNINTYNAETILMLDTMILLISNSALGQEHKEFLPTSMWYESSITVCRNSSWSHAYNVTVSLIPHPLNVAHKKAGACNIDKLGRAYVRRLYEWKALCYMQFRAWPGQMVSMPLQGLDHFSHSTSVNARLFFESHDSFVSNIPEHKYRQLWIQIDRYGQ